MQQRRSDYFPESALDHPLLEKLSDLSLDVAGISFSVLVPLDGRWGLVQPGSGKAQPGFCRLIQSSKEGAKHCKICHVLMAVAACNRDSSEHRCHAGACVLLTPVSRPGENVVAVLSTCMFTQGTKTDGWKETRARGKELGLSLTRLKRAYARLPELTPEQVRSARLAMEAVAEAVREIQARLHTENKLLRLRGRTTAGVSVQSVVEKGLRTAMSVPPPGIRGAARRQSKKAPPVIEVVVNLVGQEPSMPFTVSDIAAAARMTPNHFSSVFHRYVGQRFSEFLTKKRIDSAKELLRDLTLNICEVALKAGYDDPGYFTRLFKRKTGKTPGAWRGALRSKRS